MTSDQALETMSEPRRAILTALKRNGPMPLSDLVEIVGISYEGVRQQVGRLERDGWAARTLDRPSSGPGRPRSLYRLTSAGEHLFPKEYDELAVALIDAAQERLGPEAVRSLLEDVAAKKVERLAPRVEGKPVEEKLQILRGVYRQDDPYCRVEYDAEGSPCLVEVNCPYLEVARRRPALCSVTVSVLRRLLGHRVVRTDRFQDGDGRCVFQVAEKLPEASASADAPLFDWEPEPRDGDEGLEG